MNGDLALARRVREGGIHTQAPRMNGTRVRKIILERVVTRVHLSRTPKASGRGRPETAVAHFAGPWA